MRYTTIIDLRDWPQLYANLNIRLLWLELTLGANYQDAKRDLYTGSLRAIAARAGITLSATRHGLSCLEKEGLIKRSVQGLFIKKWLPAVKPTPRKISAPSSPIIEASATTIAIETQKAAYQAEQQKNAEEGTTTFIKRYERQYSQAVNGDAHSLSFCRSRENRLRYEKDCKATGHQILTI